MKENLLQIINKAALSIILLLAFLQPLLFLDIFTDVFELPKTLLLYSSIALLLLLLALRWLLTGVKMRYDRFLFVLILLAAAAAFSSYFGSSRLVSALYGLPPLVSLVLLYFLALQFFAAQADEANQPNQAYQANSGLISNQALLLYSLLASGLVLALWRLASFAQVYLPLTGPLGDLLRARAFTPAGSGISLTLYLSMLFPLALGLILERRGGAEKPLDVRPEGSNYVDPSGLISLFSVLYLLAAGLALIFTGPAWAVFVLIPLGLQLFFTPRGLLRSARNKLLVVTTLLLVVTALFHLPLNLNNQLLKYTADFPRDLQPGLRTSWIVAVNTVRDYPLFGTGLGTFASDFARFRPLDYNLSPTWFIRFGSSSNYVFQLLTTLGLLGLGLYLVFAGKVLSLLLNQNTRPPDHQTTIIIPSLLAFFLSNLFAVPSLGVLATFILLLTVFSSASPGLKILAPRLTGEGQRDLLSPLLFAPFLFLSAAGLYLTIRLGYGEFTFRQSLVLIREQKVVEGFNKLQQVLSINPYRDNYHLSAAALSFSLADQAAARILAANYSLLPDPKEAAPSTNVTNDRALLMQLLDYAVKEAKNAITLDPASPDNWESLASIYRNIAGFVQNAADWSVATYRQAIAVDPINPLLRLNLGGLFYLANDFENASNFFRDAVLLKGDLPNARYNLAWAYRQKGLIGAAVNEMTVVTRLLPLDSADYQKANEDLEQFKALLPPPAGGQATLPETSEELKLATPSAELAQPKPQKITLPEAAPEGGQAMSADRQASPSGR